VHRIRRLFVAAPVAAALFLTGCGGHADVVRSINAATVGAGAGFSPDKITVHKDDNVTLDVGNSTATTHGFSIEGYGIHDTVEPGKPLKVKFSAGKPGTFKIFCQLHPAHQMATLVVE
jgi:nitrosocyanin